MLSIITYFASSVIANAIILYVVSTYIPQLWFSISNPWGGNIYMVFAILGTLFRLFNGIIKSIIKVLTLPFAIITLGLSSVVINIAIIYVFGYVINTSSLGIQVQVGGLVQTLILSSVIAFAYFILKKIL